MSASVRRAREINGAPAAKLLVAVAGPGVRLIYPNRNQDSKS